MPTNSFSRTVILYKNWIFWGFFLINLASFWPGTLVSDSSGQYQMAVSGLYGDHHPPLMSLLWRYFDMIIPGPALMYALQLVLLYGGLFMVLKTFEKRFPLAQHPYVFLLVVVLPWLPTIFLQTAFIQKDNVFATGFLYVSSLLGYWTLNKKQPGLLSSIGVLALLMFATAVKYQAQFCAPILLTWFGILIARNHNCFKKLLLIVLLNGAFFPTLDLINDTLVPQTKKSNAWQYVKFFDLAAISIDINQDLIPSAHKTEFYSFETLKRVQEPNSVDPYIYVPQSILGKSNDPKIMSDLRDAWAQAVRAHPISYLKHRLTNFGYVMLSRKGFSHQERYLSKVFTPGTASYATALSVTGVLGYVFCTHLPLFVLGLCYLIASLLYFKRSDFAPILFGFTLTGFMLSGVVLFMSMAGTPRYVIMTMLMLHGSHILAYGLYRDLKKGKQHR